MILLIWTQFARYVGIFFEEDTAWSFWIFNFKILAFNYATHLPFYICRLSVWVLLYYTITKDKRVESFLFFWGATGIAGVIYPNSSDIFNIYNLTETFFVDHFLLAVTPFFLLAIQGYRPSKKDALIITGVMITILTLFIPINSIMATSLTKLYSTETIVDYFYLNDQSIVRVLFGKVPKIVFISIHSLTAYLFFNIYYFIGNRYLKYVNKDKI